MIIGHDFKLNNSASLNQLSEHLVHFINLIAVLLYNTSNYTLIYLIEPMLLFAHRYKEALFLILIATPSWTATDLIRSSFRWKINMSRKEREEMVQEGLADL